MAAVPPLLIAGEYAPIIAAILAAENNPRTQQATLAGLRFAFQLANLQTLQRVAIWLVYHTADGYGKGNWLLSVMEDLTGQIVFRRSHLTSPGGAPILHPC